MKPMRGFVDRILINLESEKLPLDAVGVFVLDPSTAPDRHDYLRVRAELAARIPRIPMFTNRFIAAPFGAGYERWVTDPKFSIDRHLIHLGAPAPYDLSALFELTVSLFDKPLERDRPLWQMCYVDGLADGSAALLFRFHHACIDGVGFMEMMAELFDAAPLPADPNLSSALVGGERVPSGAEMLVRSIPDQLLTPFRLAYRALPLAPPIARQLISRIPMPPDVIGHRADVSVGPPGGQADAPTREPGPVPRSLLNQPTETPKRSVAAASIPMADIGKIEDRFGVTFNDVVLSVTSAAVADYLRERDALPAEPLRVAQPVNIRDEAAESGFGNYWTLMMVAVPSDITDPVERLKTVSVLTKKAKPARTGDTMTRRKPTSATLAGVMRLIDAVPGITWSVVGYLGTSSPLAKALPTVINYIVSTVPGPKESCIWPAQRSLTCMDAPWRDSAWG